MKNLIVSVTLLTLLSTGVYFYNTNKSQLSATTDDTPLEDVNCGCKGVTFSQWKTCIYKAKIGQCDDLSPSKVSSCYQASAAASVLMHPDLTNQCPCVKFWQWYERANANDQINENDYYRQCFSKTSLIQAAKKDSYYYRNIFEPQYLSCANIRI